MLGPLLTKEGDTLVFETRGRWAEKSEQRDKIKDIPGRRWDNNRKVWLVPAEPGVADQILKTMRSIEADEALMSWLKASMIDAEESLTSPIPSDSQSKLLIPWAYERCEWQPEFVNDEKFEGALDYQRAAIEHAAIHKRLLLCDDMGLGKTFEAISAVEEYILRAPADDYGDQPSGPRLAIAPASVLGGWSRELHRWLPDANVHMIDGKTPKTRHTQLTTAINESAWVIVNWEQIRVKKVEVKVKNGGKKKVTIMKEPLFQYPQAAAWDTAIDDWDVALYAKAAREFKGDKNPWLAAIADEIHRAKSRTALQSQGLHRISAEVMLGLTGTPIMNSPDELWSLLAWLFPDEYHDRGEAHMPGALAYWPFYMQYVKFYEDHFGRKTVTGVKNPDALRFALRGKLVRRTAGATLGLKGRKRIYVDVPLNPDQQKLYSEAEKSMWLAIQKDASAGDKDAIALAQAAAAGADMATLMRIPNGAARFVRLQQIIENAALLGGPDSSANMDAFEQRFWDSRPFPWIVFCNYKQTAEIQAERLRAKGARVAVYTGDVSSSDRTDIEDEFQRGELDCVVGTVDAMYQGITLTAGHLQWWHSRAVVPAKNEQGEARQDRLGQQEQVLVLIPQATNTVSPGKVAEINRVKEATVKAVLPQDAITEENS